MIVRGDAIPRHLSNRCLVLFAILRNIYAGKQKNTAPESALT